MNIKNQSSGGSGALLAYCRLAGRSAMVGIALIAMAGCSHSTTANLTRGPRLVLPDDELCRIRPLQTSDRYVALITPSCATDPKSVGLRFARLSEDLAMQGAH